MSNFEQHLVHFLIKIDRAAECSKAVNFVLFSYCVNFLFSFEIICKGRWSWFRC